MPGRYKVPSMALESLSLKSSCLMWSDVNVGLSTYLMSSRDESINKKKQKLSQIERKLRIYVNVMHHCKLRLFKKLLIFN